MEPKETLELQKLEAEVNKLDLENRVLAKGLEKKKSSTWEMPSVWEILKSLGIFLPLLFTSLGYYRSMEQDRLVALGRATDAFLAKDDVGGTHLLEAYAIEHCGTQMECLQKVAGILVSGVHLKTKDENALERSLLAVQALDVVRPEGSIADDLCRRVADGVRFLDQNAIKPANEARGDAGLPLEERERIGTEAENLLRSARPALCAAVETGLCSESLLESQASEAWRNLQTYRTNHPELTCKG